MTETEAQTQLLETLLVRLESHRIGTGLLTREGVYLWQAAAEVLWTDEFGSENLWFKQVVERFMRDTSGCEPLSAEQSSQLVDRLNASFHQSLVAPLEH